MLPNIIIVTNCTVFPVVAICYQLSPGGMQLLSLIRCPNLRMAVIVDGIEHDNEKRDIFEMVQQL